MNPDTPNVSLNVNVKPDNKRKNLTFVADELVRQLNLPPPDVTLSMFNNEVNARIEGDQNLQNQINDLPGGTVTSVDAAGGTTGYGFTGGPITSSGILTLAVVDQAQARLSLGLGSMAVQDAGGVVITGGTVDSLSSLSILDGDASNDLIFRTANLTGNRELTFDLGDASRSLGIGVSAFVSGHNTGDQTIALTGPVTGSGTGTFATTITPTGVTAGSYGDSTHVGAFTVNAAGQLTAASSVAIAFPPDTGITQLTGPVTAGPGSGSQATTITPTGVTAAAYGDSTHVATFTVNAAGQLTLAAPVAIAFPPDTGITQLTGDVTAGPGSGSQAATLANTAVTPGAYGDATHVATFTVDSKGRLTAAGTVTITAGTVSSVNGASSASGFTLTGGPITSSGTLTFNISNAANARTSLGLGTMAVQDAGGVVITGGTVDSLSSLSILDGDASDILKFATANLTGTRTLTFNTGDTDRSLTIGAAASVSGTNTGDQTITLTGDVTGSGTGSFVATLANTAVTPATYGDSTHVAQFTVDSKGRLTFAQNVAISGASGGTVTSVDGASSASGFTLTGGPITTSGTLTFNVSSAASARTTLGLDDMATQNSGGVIITGGTINDLSALSILDNDASNHLTFLTSNLTGNRTLTFNTGDTNRTLTIGASASVSGTNTGDQTITLTGPVTGSGTGSFATTITPTGVTAATYGDATHVPQITINAAGQITAASSVAITDTGITQLTGDVTAGPGSGSQAATLANTAVTPGSYGDGTHVGQFTVDSKGRLTAAASVAITATPRSFHIYYGMADATLYQPEQLGTLSRSDWTTFLLQLSRRTVTGPEAAGTKYLLDNLASVARGVFYFIVPDHFGEYDDSDGFQWAGGNVGSPTALAEQFDLRTQTVFDTDKRLVSANGLEYIGDIDEIAARPTTRFAPAQDTNGWAMIRLMIGETLYRFYSFTPWIVDAPDVLPGASTTAERTSNQGLVAYNPPQSAYPWPYYSGWIQFSGLAETGLNVTQWAFDEVALVRYSFYNAGTDIANVPDVGGSFPQAAPGLIIAWMHGTGNTLSGNFPANIDFGYTQVSLFVTPIIGSDTPW